MAYGKIGFKVENEPIEIHTRTQFNFQLQNNKNVFMGVDMALFGISICFIVKKDDVWQIAVKPMHGKLRLFCLDNIDLLFDIIIGEDPFKYALAFDANDLPMTTLVSALRNVKSRGFLSWLHEKQIEKKARELLGDKYDSFMSSIIVLD